MAKVTEDFLAHYGVLGMKWGVRKDRPGKVDKSKLAKSSRSKKTSKPSEDHARARALSKKPLSSLSNSEVKALNERLQLERSYADLTKRTSTVTKGKKAGKAILATAGAAQTVYNLANGPMAKAVKKALKK